MYNNNDDGGYDYVPLILLLLLQVLLCFGTIWFMIQFFAFCRFGLLR